MASLDGSKESRRDGAESASVEESGEISFCIYVLDGAVRCMVGGRRIFIDQGRWIGCFWCQWNIPKAVGGIASSHDDDLSIFYDLDIEFAKKRDAVVVTELPDRNE